jgi:hypothetical protein
MGCSVYSWSPGRTRSIPTLRTAVAALGRGRCRRGRSPGCVRAGARAVVRSARSCRARAGRRRQLPRSAGRSAPPAIAGQGPGTSRTRPVRRHRRRRPRPATPADRRALGAVRGGGRGAASPGRLGVPGLPPRPQARPRGSDARRRPSRRPAAAAAVPVLPTRRGPRSGRRGPSTDTGPSAGTVNTVPTTAAPTAGETDGVADARLTHPAGSRRRTAQRRSAAPHRRY